jgi:hypothetical protein
MWGMFKQTCSYQMYPAPKRVPVATQVTMSRGWRHQHRSTAVNDPTMEDCCSLALALLTDMLRGVLLNTLSCFSCLLRAGKGENVEDGCW